MRIMSSSESLETRSGPRGVSPVRRALLYGSSDGEGDLERFLELDS
jgi:hypothetical protein